MREQRFAVRARRLFDGDRFWAADPVTVVVAAGRIEAIDTTGAVPAGVRLRDLGNATLLPGLIDSHTHLAFDASPSAAANVQSIDEDALLAHMLVTASRMLRYGITTVRDLGDRSYLSLHVRDRTRADPTLGPRLVAAGPPLTPTGGHCWFLGGEADGEAGLARAVAEHAERGVDVIKVMATGGRMTPTTAPHESQYTADELHAVVREAHGRDLPIAAHAHGRQGVVDAHRAGFDTLEHVSFMTAVGPAPDQAVIDAIAATGTICSVTVGVLPGASIPPMLASALPLLRAHVVNLVRSGVRICLGPDGGVSPGKPHHVLPYAIEDLVGAGLPVAVVLRAATSAAAQACQLDRVGRVAAGYEADLLAVEGDLASDVTAIHRITALYRSGQHVR